MDYKLEILQPTSQQVRQVIDLVQQLERESSFITFGPEFSSDNQANLAQILDLLPQNDQNLLLVATVKQKMVGIITVNLTDAKSLSAELGIGVLNEFQNIGLGSYLIEEALDWFENYSGLHEIWLEVYQNNPKAIHLYYKYGFKQVSARQNIIKMELKGEKVL